MINLVSTISKILEVDNLKKWVQDNPKLLHLVDKRYIGYRLNIDRPYWFDSSSSDHIYKFILRPIFSGTTQEEIFIKMYDWCLKNLKWSDGRIVNMCHYIKEFNEKYLSDIGFDPTYNSNDKSNDSYDSELDIDIDIESSDNLDNKDQSEYIIDWFDENNCYKYQNEILELFFVTRLLFYGFDGGPYDCCFSVKPEIVI